MTSTAFVLGACIAAALVGCTSDELFGPPTQAVCSDSTITYASFGQAFMTNYCVRCHASTLMGADRHGAPLLHDFDTLPGIQVFSSHIDETTASGPAATNTSMPDGDPTPSLEERQMLGVWLACGTH